MKKLLSISFAVILFSCSKDVPTYTVISGTVQNAEENKFTINGLSFEKEISVNQDGTFQDTLYLEYAGAYDIGRNSIYLENGKNVIINTDLKDFGKTKFTNNLAAENNYIVEKYKITQNVIGQDHMAFFALPENEYLEKVNKIDSETKALLDKQTFEVKDFKENETQNIIFLKENLTSIYKIYHGYVTGNPEFNVSENFPKENTNINYDDENMYNFSSTYRQLAQGNFNRSTSEPSENETRQDLILKKFNEIKSANIKADIAQNLAYEINGNNPKLEEFYNIVLQHTKDEAAKKELTEKYNKVKSLVKGNPSPKFVNYENYKGGTTSLDDLKGKYVYIDVWATWCGPCKQEIPFLKEIEKQYHGKNIEFVSLSIDAVKDNATWKEFVKKENLTGIQLFADNAWQSQFVKDYVIEGIPRFILVDPNGNIVSSDAPRPSDKELITLFTELGI